MQCPRCQNLESKVIDSRLTNKNTSIRRRRECEKCAYRFSTIETVRASDLIVIKKDEGREPYDRSKVESGIWKACEKRPVAKNQVDNVVSSLEEKWNQMKEITSQQIGEDIMEKLKSLDEVAYIRYASVYKKFKDVKSFVAEIKELVNGD